MIRLKKNLENLKIPSIFFQNKVEIFITIQNISKVICRAK